MPFTGNNGTGQVLDDSCGPNYDLQVGAFSDFGSFFDKYSEWWVNRRRGQWVEEQERGEKPFGKYSEPAKFAIVNSKIDLNIKL